MNITKKDIVKQLSQKSGISAKETNEIITTILESISVGLKENQTIKLSNFGTFTVKEKSERIGRNPKTGVEAIIPARKTVLFHPSQAFKNKIN